MGAQPRRRLVDAGERSELDRLQVVQPAVDLTLVEPVRFAESLETPGLPVDPGETGDPVDQLEGQAPPGVEVGAERLGPGGPLLNR